MHLVGSVMAFPPLLIALLSLSLAGRRAPGWRDLGGLLLILALVSISLFLLGILVLSDRGFAGLGQRLFFATVFGWIVVVARRMTRLPTAMGPPPAGSMPSELQR